jgi:hypothetical protein
VSPTGITEYDAFGRVVPAAASYRVRAPSSQRKGSTNVRVDRRFLNWGIFLIILGLVPLLVHEGVIDSGAVRQAWRLWPLIIVGIGVGIILRRTPAALAGGLIVAATFGLLFGSLFAAGTGGVVLGCSGTGSGAGAQSTRQGTFGAGTAEADITMNCGTLQVGAGQGRDWSVTARDP